MNTHMGRLALAVTLALAATAVQAQTASSRTKPQTYAQPYEGRYWSYGGASIGRSDYDFGCTAGFGCDTRETGLKLFAGGRSSEHFGLEVSYVYLGEGNRGGGDTWAQGVNLSLVGILPVSQTVSLNAKVGGIYGWTKTEGNAPGLATGREDGFGLSYGLGASIALTRTVDLRLDWDRYRFDFTTGRDDANLASVGVAFKF